jgi:hypothetical protein
MARFVHYRCPDCEGTFKYMHHPSDAPPPDRCPLCEAWVSTEAPPEEVFVPQAPRIRENAYAKSIDRVYREQEQASIERADEAAAALEDVYRAQPKEDGPAEPLIDHMQKAEIMGLRSGIKITDMKDPSSMREGDSAAISSTPPSLREGGATAAFQNLGGAIPNHTPGIGPPGEATRQALSAQHGSRAQVMTAQGQMRPTYIDRR